MITSRKVVVVLLVTFLLATGLIGEHALRAQTQSTKREPRMVRWSDENKGFISLINAIYSISGVDKGTLKETAELVRAARHSDKERLELARQLLRTKNLELLRISLRKKIGSQVDDFSKSDQGLCDMISTAYYLGCMQGCAINPRNQGFCEYYCTEMSDKAYCDCMGGTYGGGGFCLLYN